MIISKNRRSILLNVALLFFMTLLSEFVLRDFFGDPFIGAFVGGIVSSIILRLIFANGNMREFGLSKTIKASNGKIFSKKHKLIVNTVIFGSIGLSWFLAFNFAKKMAPFIPHLIIFGIFQLSVKGTLFILDLPIGTFNEDQRKVKHPTPFSRTSPTNYRTNSDQYFSPGYKHLSSNIHHR